MASGSALTLALASATLTLTVESTLAAVQGNIVTNFHVLGSVLKGLGPRALSRQQAPVKVARVTLLGAHCAVAGVMPASPSPA